MGPLANLGRAVEHLSARMYAPGHTMVNSTHIVWSDTHRQGANTLSSVHRVGESDRRLVDLGRRIRLLRQWRDLSQERLAEKARVERAYLSRIEHGRLAMRVDVLMDLADALGVDVRDFWAEDLRLPSPRDG